MVKDEMQKLAIKNFDKEKLTEILNTIKELATNGSCTLETKCPNGDTLCNILRGGDYGFPCSAIRFSDGWHVNINW